MVRLAFEQSGVRRPARVQLGRGSPVHGVDEVRHRRLENRVADDGVPEADLAAGRFENAGSNAGRQRVADHGVVGLRRCAHQ